MPAVDSEQGVVAAVAAARDEGSTLEVRGAGSKRAAGRPAGADAVLDVSGLRGIVDYRPDERIVVARPGTPVPEIRAALAERGQVLAFDPPDWGWWLGRGSAPGTIGGAVAVDSSARDAVLAVRAVSGGGEVFRTGEHVAGYDLARLLTGSWGTLAVLTEVTLKVRPAPEICRTLAVADLDDREALALLRGVAAGPFRATGLAHVSGIVTVVRVEGSEASVHRRLGELRRRYGGQVLDIDPWEDTRDARPMGRLPVVWRAVVPPAFALDLVEAVQPDGHFYDRAGGLVWLEFARPEVDQAARVRGALGDGHAMLVRAPESMRAAVEVFHPLPPALAALTARLEASFDPRGVLNPGRVRGPATT